MKTKEHNTIRPACVFCCLPTDQDVVQVDCHSGKVTCELVHDILEVPGSGADAKWKPRLKKDLSVVLARSGCMHQRGPLLRSNVCHPIFSSGLLVMAYGLAMLFQLVIDEHGVVPTHSYSARWLGGSNYDSL